MIYNDVKRMEEHGDDADDVDSNADVRIDARLDE